MWAYINERRIDSPEKCSAIMTHRAGMELLNQQAVFVKEMNQGGLKQYSQAVQASVGGVVPTHRVTRFPNCAS